MLIHGLHWAALAYHGNAHIDVKVCYQQDALAVFHVLLGPVMILGEIVALLGLNVSQLRTRENVSGVGSSGMAAFNFLQEFYLHFSQFYAHTSYALFVCTVLSVFLVCRFGIWEEAWYVPIILWVGMGIFYLIGRIQMYTLFVSERELCSASGRSADPHADKLDAAGMKIRQMEENDIDASVEMIGVAMDENEAAWARQSFDFYFGCSGKGVDSKRQYFVWEDEGRVSGLVGLHNYRWGARENVWLSWFVVQREKQRKGYGMKLMHWVEGIAREQGYEKFFVETYSSSTFEKARRFYEKMCFRKVGKIECYQPSGADMVVYGKSLCL